MSDRDIKPENSRDWGSGIGAVNIDRCAGGACCCDGKPLRAPLVSNENIHRLRELSERLPGRT